MKYILAAFAVALAAEALLRLFIVSPSFNTYDTELGYKWRPNACILMTKEGRHRSCFNDLGLNDDPIKRDRSGKRALVVGDSYTASLQVPRSKNFTSVVETLIPDMDVINAGRDGLFLDDLNVVARKLIDETNPDHLVLVISQSDIRDDLTRRGFVFKMSEQTGQALSADASPEMQDEIRKRVGGILQTSALANRLSFQAKPAALSLIERIQNARQSMTRRSSKPVTQTGQPTNVSDKGPELDAKLQFIFAEFLTLGKPVAVMYLGDLEFHPNYISSETGSSYEMKQVVEQTADTLGIPFIDATPDLIASYKETGSPPYGFNNGIKPGGHLNVSGHKAVATALARYLADPTDTAIQREFEG